ncbi:MAG: hypothetical protein AB8H86_22160 [Polyangiales bacterium]
MDRFLSSAGLVLFLAACSPSGPSRMDATVVFFDGGVDTVSTLDSGPADTGDAGTDAPDVGPSSCTTNDECDDGVYCNGAEECSAGACIAGALPDCDDGVACTADICDDEMGACRSFADSTACADGETCSASGCSSECTSDDQCTDGVFCNGAETCSDGVCTAGVVPDCDDSIPCTEDVCDELSSSCRSFPADMGCGANETCNAATGCIPECTTNAQCDDGFHCNGAESCDGGSCIAGTAPDCDDEVACTRDLCDEATDSCLSFTEDSACALGETCEMGGGCTPECVLNSDCDDGLHCTGIESCVRGACVAGTPIACNDGVACTLDICDEGADICRALPEDSRCSGGDTCSAGMGCIPACSSNADCDDGLFCTGVETCVAGSCAAGTPPPADDGVACTIEFCNEPMSLATSVPTNSLCESAGGICDPSPDCTSVQGCVGSDSAGHETFSSTVDPANCVHSFFDISGTGTTHGSGDDTIDTILLGGTGFEFFGVPMPSIRVDSNGHFSSDLTQSSDYSNGCGLGGGLSGEGVRVLVYHDDLYVNELYHQYFGVCPRRHDFDASRGCNIIQWDVRHLGGPVAENWMMQAVLYEGGEDMAFVYDGDTRENGVSGTVGYVNPGRSVGVEWGCNSDGIVANNSTLCTYATTSCP